MRKLISLFSINNPNSIFIFSVFVGVISGIISMIFSWLLHLLESFFSSFHVYHYDKSNTIFEKVDFVFQHPPSALIVLLLPALGGLMAGLIIYHFCKEAKGTGTDEMIYAFHRQEGKLNTQIPLYKSLATLFTLPTGGSGGKEGPISFIGAGIGVWIAYLIKAGSRARRTLMLAGTAAGLGAVFKTPLGGALTAVEMVYKEDIESDALIPCFISSVTAYLVYTAYAGTEPFLNVSSLTDFHFKEIGFYLLLGLMCYLIGFVFIKGFNQSKSLVAKWKVPSYIKPAIGGLLTGVIALFFFEVSGTGHGFLQYTITGNLPDLLGLKAWYSIALSLLVIALLKILATTLTIGSGGSAGIFGPSLFIGAMLGAAVGVVADYFLKEDVKIASFMVVGMGAFYAAVANAPIAGIIMIVEMTGSYVLLPPLIIVSIFSFILSKQISFYKNQVDNRFKSPAHAWELKMDVIDEITLKEYFPEFRLLAVVRRSDPLTEVQKLASEIHASDFVVVNNKLQYIGMLTLRHITYEDYNVNREKLLVSNFIDKSIPCVRRSDKLSKVLNLIMTHDIDKVAVVEDNIMIGYVRSRDIFEAYTEQLKKRKKY